MRVGVAASSSSSSEAPPSPRVTVVAMGREDSITLEWPPLAMLASDDERGVDAIRFNVPPPEGPPANGRGWMSLKSGRSGNSSIVSRSLAYISDKTKNTLSIADKPAKKKNITKYKSKVYTYNKTSPIKVHLHRQFQMTILRDLNTPPRMILAPESIHGL